jgi:hypothetical protein
LTFLVHSFRYGSMAYIQMHIHIYTFSKKKHYCSLRPWEYFTNVIYF